MSDMNPDAVRSSPEQYVHHPREIAAAVTLTAAAAALVAPAAHRHPLGPAALSSGQAAAIATACGALATRIALVRVIAAESGSAPRRVSPHDPFSQAPPLALRGRGGAPDRDRVRLAGDRCAAVWHAWKQQGAPTDERVGVAGALALGAWCAWALGSDAAAAVRARYALDTSPRDPLAALVLRSVRAGAGPTWWG